MNTINDHSKYLEIVKTKVDKDWLKQEYDKINQYYKTDKNTIVLGPLENFVSPLGLLLFQAEKNITERKTNSGITLSNETVDMIRLGLCIDTLQTNVRGFNEKMAELCKASKNHFEKIFNELNIASGFAKSNHLVEFVKTKSDEKIRTPDLLIDGIIEVECKKKDRLTPRDIKNNELWNKLEKKSIELMNEHKRYYLLYAYFEKDPTSPIIRKILNEFRKIILSGRDTEINVSGVKIIANKISEVDEIFQVIEQVRTPSELFSRIDPNEMDKKIGEKISNPEIVNYENNRPDYDRTPFRSRTQQNGSVIIDRLMKFLFKSKVKPDRLKGIINSINSARGQISGDKIVIICVNMTHISQKLIESDLALLGQMIKDLLKNNPRISAVGVTSEFYIKDRNGIRYRHQASIIRNDVAVKPLPSDFVIDNQS